MRPILAAFALVALAGATSAQAADQKDSPTLGAKPPVGAIVLFNGKDLSAWRGGDGKSPAPWTVEDGIFTVKPKSGVIRTDKTFGSFIMHLEFNVPYMPDAKGQARGNSGVYLQGKHELQVLDSYGLPPKNNECGAIYQQIVPSVNACLPPLRWQTYDITFHAAKDGKKARISVEQNGQTIIDDKEIVITPGNIEGIKEEDDGPIMLQDHGNPVSYRNIWLKPI
jgi:hypothetical protein